MNSSHLHLHKEERPDLILFPSHMLSVFSLNRDNYRGALLAGKKKINKKELPHLLLWEIKGANFMYFLGICSNETERIVMQSLHIFPFILRGFNFIH